MPGTRTAPTRFGGGITLLATAAIFIAVVGLPASASAAIAGSEGKIAFQRWNGNNWDIWIRDSRLPQCSDGQDNDNETDGVDLEDPHCDGPNDHDETVDGRNSEHGSLRLPGRLTSSAADETNPAWAPLTCGDLSCLGGQRPWFNSASVFPLEQVLAFVSEDPAAGRLGDIWAVEPPATDPLPGDPPAGAPAAQPLFESPTADDDSPSFNSAGVMAFDSKRNGDRDIYAVPMSLFDNPNLDPNVDPYRCQLTSGSAEDSNPEWSPDGSHIIFQREQGGDIQLWVIDVSVPDDPSGCTKSPPRPVTAGQLPSYEPTWFDWSPGNGVPERFAHGIAFTGPGERDDNDVHYFEQTYEQGAEPSSPFAGLDSWPSVTLFDDTGDAQGPSWSPFGTGFVFATGPQSGHALRFLSLEDTSASGVQPLTDSYNDLNPAIQPRPQADIKPRPVCGRACQARRRRAKAASVAQVTRSAPGVGVPGTPSACTIRGKPGNDRKLIGTPGPDVICGFGGNDFIDGRGGNDKLLGGAGRDQLRGGRGRDRLSGGPGGDGLWGGPDGDRLIGGPGKDRMFGQGGPDSLLARDGRRDMLSGGPGKDTVSRDRRDDVAGAGRGNR
jgi:hypothetical protein